MMHIEGMMEKTEILTLYDYNYWGNHRVLEAARKVTAEQFEAPAFTSHKSLRGTLAHILGTEIVWRMRCQEGISPSSIPAEQDFPTLELLIQKWVEEEKTMRTYLSALEEKDLVSVVRYTNTKGNAFENTLWKILFHVVNHGSQFRAEAGVLLAEYGHSPGDLDFIFYVRQTAPQ